MLDEHAAHLLLADEENGVWPAAPFLEHPNTTSPDTARPWLAPHAEQLAAGGPGVLDALLRLALAGALTPASVRSLLPHITAPTLPGRFRGSAGSRADSRPAGHGPSRWRPATGTGRWPRRSC